MLESTDYALEILHELADPGRAAQMQAYMKTDMAFFGVGAKDRKATARQLTKRFAPTTPHEYRSQVGELWAQPWREAKYLAMDVAVAHKDFITPDQLDLYEQMIREGGWWDFVDVIASHLVGRLSLQHPDEMRPILEAWIDDEDMWIRRSAILAHLGHKERTDEQRLFDFCLRRAHETEFFIRKAIGWALRQYARVEPDAVRLFVETNASRLSGLTKREATKHL